MATKFLDKTGLSHFWSKFKEWCNSIFVTKATDENITGTKTFVGSKKVAFKQSGANDKLGFTLFNNSGKEQGYLEYNSTNKIAGIPLMMLGNYATAADELTYVGFRRYSNISGASGAYNLLTPLISDAKSYFNLTTTYTNFYLPLGISDGTNVVTADNGGVVNISSLLPSVSTIGWSNVTSKPTTISGYGITDAKIANGTITLGSNSITPLTNDSDYVHKTGIEVISGVKNFSTYVSHSSNIDIHHDFEKGDDISSSYRNITFCDTNTQGITTPAHRLAVIESFIENASNFNDSTLDFRVYRNIANSTEQAIFRIGWDSNGNQYVTAPVTRSIGVTNADVVTYGHLANDSRLVHTSGDENIGGKKLFTGSELIIKHTATKGTTPSTSQYRGIYFVDSNGTLNASGHDRRFGRLESVVYNSGDTGLWLTVYKNIASNTDSASLTIYWDSTNSIGVASAPSTSTARTNGTDIVTRDWMPKDTRLVHTTGVERIDGQKTFLKSLYVESAAQSNAWTGIRIKNMGTDRSIEPSQAYWPGDFSLMDKNDNVLFSLSRYADSVTQELIISSYSQGSSSSAGTVHLNWNKNKRLHSFYPDPNNTITLGASDHLWKEVFAGNTVISSSDERLKSSISSVPDEVLDAWENVNFVQYQFNDAISEKGSSARFHNGLVAQNIYRIFKANNLDASKYGLFCYDEWDAEPERKDEKGNVVQPATPAGNRYSLRYIEALCMEATYQRRKNKFLENRISELEKRLAKLEGIV